MSGSGGVNDASAAMSVHGNGDARALQRVYCLALNAINERIAIDEEIERRLAVIGLFAVSAQTADCADLPNEGAIVASCVDRLMAQTAPDELVADTL